MGGSRPDHSLGKHDPYHSVSHTATQLASCGIVLAYDAAAHRVSKPAIACM